MSAKSWSFPGKGLKEYFAAVEIVADKDAQTYKNIVNKYELLPDSTWMVGNSPKSDIDPALLAGLNAVFCPLRPDMDSRA